MSQHPFVVGGHLHKRLMWELLDKMKNPNKLAVFSLESDPDEEGVSMKRHVRPGPDLCPARPRIADGHARLHVRGLPDSWGCQAEDVVVASVWS